MGRSKSIPEERTREEGRKVLEENERTRPLPLFLRTNVDASRSIVWLVALSQS